MFLICFFNSLFNKFIGFSGKSKRGLYRSCLKFSMNMTPAKAGIHPFNRKISNLTGISVLFLVFIGITMSTPTSSAKTLIVRAPFKAITLSYDWENISITGFRLHLSLKRKDCNGYILSRFRRQMEALLKSTAFTKKRKEKKSLEIQIGNKKLFVPFHSKEAQILINLPIEVKRMKLEGAFICRNP